MLDRARARAEADAAERRGAGTLWGAGPVAWEGVTAGTVAQAEVVPTVDDEPGDAVASPARVAPLRRAEPHPGAEAAPTALLAAILARLEMVPPATGVTPDWLVEAIGNPLSYDAAAPHRKDVCARGPGALPAVAGDEGAAWTADDRGGVGVRAAGGAGCFRAGETGTPAAMTIALRLYPPLSQVPGTAASQASVRSESCEVFSW